MNQVASNEIMKNWAKSNPSPKLCRSISKKPVTSRLLPKFTKVPQPRADERTRSGNISERTSHVIGPSEFVKRIN